MSWRARSLAVSNTKRLAMPVVVAAIGFVLLLFVTPLVIGLGAISLLAPVYAAGAILVAFAGLALSVSAGRALPIRKSLWLGTALLVVGSLVPALRRSVPLDRVFYVDRLGILFATILAYLGAIAVLRDGRARPLRRAFLHVLLALVVMHVGFGLFRFFGADQDRMSGLVYQPNFFASIVAAFALPVVLPVLAAGRFTQQMLIGGAGLFCALVFSGSRAALALAVLAALAFALTTRRGRKLGFWIAMVAGVVALLLATVPNPLKHRLERKVDQSFPRTFIWTQAGAIAAEHPLGIGLGMHQYYFAQRAFIPEEPSLSYRRHEIGIAHNMILGSAAEAGVLGGLGALLLVASYFGLAFTRRGRARFRDNASLRALYCAAGILVLHAQVDGVAQNVIALGSLAVLAAFVEVGLQPSRSCRRKAERSFVDHPALRAIAGSLVILAAATPTLLAYCTSHFLRVGVAAGLAGDYAVTRDSLALARRFVPQNGPAALAAAQFAQREFERKTTAAAALEVDQWCAELARANPLDTRAYTLSGDTRRALYFSQGEGDLALLRAARDQYDRALAVDPLDLKTRLVRVRLHRLLHDDARAEADLDEVLRIEPAHPLALEIYGDFELARGNRAAARARFCSAIDAWRAAQVVLADSRYGNLPYLTEIVVGFTPRDCEERVVAIDAGK